MTAETAVAQSQRRLQRVASHLLLNRSSADHHAIKCIDRSATSTRSAASRGVPLQLQLQAGAVLLEPTDIIWGGAHIASQPGGQAQADATIRALLLRGVRDFDTAPWYSAGLAEEMLGRALHAAATDPDTAAAAAEARIHTKAGKLVVARDNADPRQIRLDGSVTVRAGVNDHVLRERAFLADYSHAGARLSCAQSRARCGLAEGAAVHGLRIHDPHGVSRRR